MIQPRNYCTHAIEEFEKHRYYTAHNEPQEVIEQVEHLRDDCVTLLHNAEKFLLPEWGRIFDEADMKVFEDTPTMNRLPYPVVACEYDCDYTQHDTMIQGEAPSSRRISLAAEIEAIEALCPNLHAWLRHADPVHYRAYHGRPPKVLDSGFVVLPVCYFDYAKIWTPPPAIAFYRREDHPQTRIVDVIVTALGLGAYSSYPPEEQFPRAQRDVTDECIAAAHLILALGMERVSQTTIPEPTKLNKKRERTGKPKLYEYKVLDIVADLMESPREKAGRPHGKHASPRMHKRRGHIRRLASGNVTWVRNTIVGKPGHGEVRKDYRVHS